MSDTQKLMVVRVAPLSKEEKRLALLLTPLERKQALLDAARSLLARMATRYAA